MSRRYQVNVSQWVLLGLQSQARINQARPIQSHHIHQGRRYLLWRW